IYQNVFKLPPGHTLVVRRNSPVPDPRQYWDVSFDTSGASHGADVGAELIDRFGQCVKKRMIAEVPLGAFLSGGVDSSAVVAMMAESSDKPVNTCCISFGDPQFNESDHAKSVAQRYATSHEVEQVDPNDISLIDKLVGLYDEPYADSSAMPTYRVCELARRNVTVALS
ncbi:MAG: asparagine synthetase B, partial [Hyphomicrobiales bacterium]|nr:asparagine synthetase B [Hyphomicrobiales bacterium]